MTAQILLLLLLLAAFLLAIVVLVHEWRWRHSPARPPLPGSQVIGSRAAAVGSMVDRGFHRLRRIGRDRAADDHTATLSADAVESVVAGRPRAVRPARIVVSGSRGPALTGVTVTARRSDPRQRLVRDTVAVLSLGVAVVAFLLAFRFPSFEGAVLGATGTPDGRTPLPALVTAGPSAIPVGTPSPEPEPLPGASSPPPSRAASPAAPATATPRPTRTPDRTPAPTRTPTPEPTPTAPSIASPSPDGSPSPSPEPTPSPSPEPTPSPSPEPTPSPSPEPTPSPSPSPSPSLTPPP